MSKNVDQFSLSPDSSSSEKAGKWGNVFYTAKKKEGEREIDAKISSEQLKIIKEVLRKDIRLNIRKDHKLTITILENDKFNIVIDNKAKFFISRQTPPKDRGVPGKERILVLQEKFEKRTIFSSFTDFFSAVVNLFYKPTFPNAALKARTPKESLKEDYRSLRKGLESGRTWLDPKDRIVVTAAGQTERKALLSQIDQSIGNAKKIEKALNSKNPEVAFERLSDEWAQLVFNKLEGPDEFLVPVGYLNTENVLQPVMLRFFKDKNGQFMLEIFSETTEGGKKLNPIQLRQFTGEPTSDHLQKVLQAFFKPLMAKNPDLSLVQKAVQPSQTFGEIYSERRAEELKKLKVEQKETEKEKPVPVKPPSPPSASLTYENLLRSLDAQMNGTWQAEATTKMITPSTSPASRIVKYFDHLLSQMEKEEGTGEIGKNAKLNLLYHLMNNWLDDQLKSFHKKTPLSQQLETYESCLEQINHVVEKIAVAINEGHPLDSEGIPESLREKQKLCQTKIAEIRAELRHDSVVAMGAFLGEKHKIKVEAEPLRAGLVEEEALSEAVALSVTFKPKRWERDWEASREVLKGLLSPENITKHQAEQALLNLYHAVEGVSPEEVRPIGKPEWNEFKELIEKEEYDKLVESVIDTFLVETGYLKMVHRPLEVDRGLNLKFPLSEEYQEEFASILKQLILCPHLIPQYDVSKVPINKEYLLSMIHRLQDASLTSTRAQDAKAFEMFDAVLGLRHLIPPEKRQAYEEAEWENQGHRFETLKTAQGKEDEERVKTYKKLLDEVERDRSPLDLVSRGGGPALDLSNIDEVEKSNREFHEQFSTQVSALTEACQALNEKAISETDMTKRKEWLQKLQEHSLQVLQLLPPPMAPGAHGEDSIWNNLSVEQRRDLFEKISSLEHFIWESQMKLAESEMDGKARFLLIKAQVIKQALIRAEIHEVRADIEKDLTEMLRNPLKAELLQPLLNMGMIKTSDDSRSIKLPMTQESMQGTRSIQLVFPMTQNSMQIIKKLLTENAPEGGKIPNVEMLLLDNYTLDTYYFNQLLTQDLTALLSRDAEMERDLMAVYHFVTRDYNCGMDDTIQTPTDNFGRRVRNYYRANLFEAEVTFEDETTRGYVQRMQESNVRFRTVSDPDFTLYSTTPVVGVPYFQAKPVVFLRQRELSIDLQGHPIAIKGDRDIKLAEVYVQGHPIVALKADVPETKEDELKVRPKKPFLPIVDNSTETAQEITSDLRTHKPYNVWVQYIEEISQGQSLAIPPQVMLSLFLIRQAPKKGDKYYATAYSADTSIRALSFLANSSNQKYLQYDFVQQYLEESLFGSFLMQQALIEHPDLIVSALEVLGDRLAEAADRGDLEAVSFISGVVQQMQAHAHLAEEVLAKEGLFGGLATGNLPIHMGTRGGALFDELLIMSSLRQERDKRERNLKMDESVADSFDQVRIAQPFVHHLAQIHQCVEKLNELVENIKSDDSADPLKSYFAKDGKEYAIDKVKNLQMRRQMYVNALESYRRSLGGSEPPALSEEDFRHLLVGDQLICDPGIEGERLPQQRRLIEWVHASILPQFHALDGAKKNQVLTDVVNAQLSRQGLNPLPNVGHWEQSKENPSIYKLQPSDPPIELNLFTMALTGFEEQKLQRQKLIPDSILRRTEVQQAFKTDRIMAVETKIGKQVTYTWEHQGQTFTITAGEQLNIERKIDNKVYVFQPVTMEEVNDNAHALLADNGLWVSKANENNVYIFTQGMDKPGQKDKYMASFKPSRKAGEKILDHLRTPEGKLVSTSPRFDQTSPLLFVNPKNVIVILDRETKLPTEFRLKNSKISFRMNETKRWVAFDGDTELGTIAFPRDEKAVADYFGDNWDQFVVPLKKADQTLSYLILPYDQKVDNKGNVVADQDSLEMKRVEYLTQNPDGSIKGTLSSELYLAHAFLQQASKTKNSTKANQLYLKAESHLHRLKLARPPSDPEQLMKLQHIFEMIQAHPVSLAAIPSPAALALNLRLFLTMRNIRANATLPVQKMLIPSTRDNFLELETIAKMYEAYSVLDVPKEGEQVEKLHKTAVKLTEGEKGDLLLISRQLVQEMAIQTPQEYFGASGRLESGLQMVRPETLDPQFLLTLMRVAKKPDPAFDIRKVTAPMPFNDLLENYWSYFISIREHQVGPDQLLFLFQESVLPPTQSPEEEAHLKAMDLQARQFLLSFADLQEELKKDHKKLLEDKLEEAKKEVGEVFSKEDLLSSLGKLVPDLESQARDLYRAFNDLTVGSKVIPIGSQNKTIPDVEKLVKEMTGIDSQLFQFSLSLNTMIREAKSFASAQREKLEERKEEIKKTTHEIKQTEEASQNGLKALDKDFEKKKSDLKKEQELQEKAIELNFNQQKQKAQREADAKLKLSPAAIKEKGKEKAELSLFQKEEIKNELVLQLDNLEKEKGRSLGEVGASFLEQNRKLDDSYNREKEVIKQKATSTLERLTENNKANEEALEQFLKEKVRNPITSEEIEVEAVTSGEYEAAMGLDELSELSKSCDTIQKTIKKHLSHADEAIKKLEGLVKIEQSCAALREEKYAPQPGLSFTEEARGREKLKKIIKELRTGKFETMTVTQKANLARELIGELGIKQGLGLMKKLMEYGKGNLGEKIMLFATPLEAMVFSFDEKPIKAGPALSPSQQPLGLDLQKIVDNPFAKQCFTEEQLKQMTAHFNTLNTVDRQSFLSELSKALKLHESVLSAQTGIAANLDKINSACRNMGILVPRALQKAHTPKALPKSDLLEKCHRESHFEDRYGQYFKGRHDFVVDQANLDRDLRTTVVDRDAIGRQVTALGFIKQHLDPQKGADVNAIAQKFTQAKYIPLVQALEGIVKAKSSDPVALKDFMTKVQGCVTGVDLLKLLEQTYGEVIPQLHIAQHDELVRNIVAQTLPDKEDSVYTQDLKKGFENLKGNNPLPYSAVLAADQIGAVRAVVQSDILKLQSSVKNQEDEILLRIKSIPLKKLPQDMQIIRFRGGSDQELLQAVYLHYSKGFFNPETFDAEPAPHGESNDLSLDELISLCQIDTTRLKMLFSSKSNASASLDALEELNKSRQELLGKYDAAGRPEEKERILNQMKAVDAAWLKQSNRLRDCLNRCQSTDHLKQEKLHDRLKPHIRKILYIQNRYQDGKGMILRQDQIEALREQLENPSFLLQMRMGLGKTSILIPFIFGVLSAEGYHVIGMVPKSQFTKNFDEMDDTTRLIHELAGKQFLFSRESVPKPFTTVVLNQISQQCCDFFTALEKGDYVLSNIESKASLDDKISEVERSQQLIHETIKGLKEQGEDSEALVKSLYQQSSEHQIVLDLLYRVKATYEDVNTRLIIDEADQVARANYSVNSEIGTKEKPAPLLVDTVSKIFDIIQGHKDLAELRKTIFANEQFTLSKEKQDEYIGIIGEAWLKERMIQMQHEFPELLKSDDAKERLLKWFKGEPSSFSYSDFHEMGTFANELKAMRKGLNSALRASLDLKLGLEADFDPTHSALGIPASQGTTSKTTKYSDPMMQLCLTNMIAMYKTQGEQFLASAAREVQEKLLARLESVSKKVEAQEGEIGPERVHVPMENDPLSPALLQGAVDILADLQAQKKEGVAVNYREALTGTEPEKVLLRKELAHLVTERKWIYISEGQISRPVQHALRGCNVIGLTGTATRNLTHVISSNGNETGMKNVEEAGRQSTAEVVYRLVKSLPEGLDTPVKAYPSTNTLSWVVQFAKVNSGYNFFVNQAGICDTYSQKEMVKALHYSEGLEAGPQRPIVFLDMENDKDSVMIKGVIKKMADLTPEEKKLVREQGFYFYHIPHSRGTHFDIPIGSKGALMLSPMVNANDRDQAMYRARELGEGHVVEPYISEKQKEDLEVNKGGKAATVADMLKDQHNKTLSDEEKENLSAYKLHIAGLLTLAVEKAKEDLQLRGDTKDILQKGEWASKDKSVKEKNERTIEVRARVFELLESFFIQESGNKAVLRQLDKEINQGGEIETNLHLIELVDLEIMKADRLMERIEEQRDLSKDNEELTRAFQMTLQEIERTKVQLEDEKEKLEQEWGKMKAHFSDTTPAAPSVQETAETEAEQEEQQEQQAQAETLAEVEDRKRRGSTKSIFEELDHETLDEIRDDQFLSYIDTLNFTNLINSDMARTNLGTVVWKPSILISHRLDYQLKNATGSSLPEMKIVVVRKENKDCIFLVDPWEGDNISSSRSNWLDCANNSFFNGGVFSPSREPNGELKLVYVASAPMLKGIKDEYESPQQQAEIILALLHIGLTQLTDDQWGGLESYWKDLGEKEKEELKNSLEAKLGKTNPSFLNQISLRLWNKPKEKRIRLGQTTEAAAMITDLSEAKKALGDHLREMQKVPLFDKDRTIEKWIRGNVELNDEQTEELRDFGDQLE